jgi:hypothetical protein
LLIFSVIQPQIDDGVPFFFEFFCKGPHGGEKRHYCHPAANR